MHTVWDTWIVKHHLIFYCCSLVEEFWRMEGFWRETFVLHVKSWRNAEECGDRWRLAEARADWPSPLASSSCDSKIVWLLTTRP
jgi:hypothetical protein